jgi:hypothetical protein
MRHIGVIAIDASKRKTAAMTKTIATVLAIAAGFAAVPAAAQTTGTVNVTGTVGGRCSVVAPGGTTETATFGGTIDLQRLDATDGTLRSALTASTAASPAEGLSVGTRIVCNSANPTVGISATALNTGGATDPGAGYSNDINYWAQVKVNTASGGVKTVSYSTLTGGAATTAQLGERIAAGNANNVSVSVHGLAAEAGATSLLAEGRYAGTVIVTVNPTM